MIGVAVVNSYLFALFYIAQGEKDDFISGCDTHVSVRLAGMVDVGGFFASNSTVNSEVIVEPDDLEDTLAVAHACLDLAFALQQFAGIGGNLLTLGKWDAGKAALPVDAAFPDFQFLGHTTPLALISILHRLITDAINQPCAG